MELWQKMIRNSIHTVDQLVQQFGINKEVAEQLDESFQARINPYYLSLIRYKGDPIWKQCVPDEEELTYLDGFEDPLNEDAMSPVPNITHRYPDRCLFLVTSQCGMFCRFCTRKRKVGDSGKISMKQLESALNYIEGHKEIRDIILSGGDPLILTDFMLEKILKRLREIPHVEIIRLGTRMPCVLPHRITPKLCEMIKKYHPVYVNTHFNHPWEITEESAKACSMLIDAGCPVNNQAVLMRGVNDDAEVMKELLLKLLKIRVRPYYLFMADETKGTGHFRTSVNKGLEIIDKLRGHVSGLAIPHFVIDAPGGGGKIPLLPKYVLHHDKDKIILRNYKNENYIYKESKIQEQEDSKLEIEISNRKNGKSTEPKKIKERKIKTTELVESNS
ncbi:MAG: KamA family radical SAM protein [Ignavibacteria bacterium]|jgi:lysine 2,3-aminomutase